MQGSSVHEDGREEPPRRRSVGTSNALPGNSLWRSCRQMDSNLTTNTASPRVAPRSARREQTRAGTRGRHSLRQEAPRTAAARAPQDERLARALGWFSLGLGVAEVVAPRGVARLVGLEDE